MNMQKNTPAEKPVYSILFEGGYLRLVEEAFNFKTLYTEINRFL